MRKHRLEVFENKVLLFNIQLLESGVAVGVASWTIATLIKNLLLSNYQFGLNPWTQIFFHPNDSRLMNYIFLCISLGVYGSLIYILRSEKAVRFIEHKLKEINIIKLTGSVFFSGGILASSFVFPSKIRAFTLSLVVFLPLCYIINFRAERIRKLLKISTLILLFFLSIEPLNMVRGPVYLMNEYEDLYTETYINRRCMNNKVFLDSLADVDLGIETTITNIYQLNKEYLKRFSREKIKSECINVDIKPARRYLNLGKGADKFGCSEFLEEGGVENKDFLDRFKNIDSESIKEMYLKNFLEYFHQNMSRGQINHIGHVLNPINEYQLGKPLKDIYVQYGLGNTFIMKWTMNLFGGISIENYYKCYIYYVPYFLSFLLMLYLLFKDWFYVFGVFTIATAAFFYQGFIDLVVAPGIIPTIHLFDTTVLIFLLLFFRYYSLTSMGFVALFTLLSIIVNPQFGAMLAGAVMVSIFLYVFENKHGRGKYVWFLYLLTLLILGLFIFKLAPSNPSGNAFKYFLLGLFSWRPHTIIVVLTICYLVVSYYFLCLLKEYRNYLKYTYLFVFVYVQGLFIYYYWSGLVNHLPAVMPFLGLQCFLMIFIAQKLMFQERMILKKILDMSARGITILAVVFMIISAIKFYGEKSLFRDNFIDHRIYHWEFERAKIITTINPEPIKGGIALIRKYSDENNPGIFIMSKYDNLLPFLANRYSLMPFFEMPWHLFSKKEVTATINKLKSEKPKYIFVDSKIDEKMFDPWSKLYRADWDNKERASRFGRYSELQKIFKAIVNDYEKIDKGELLSVYKRRVIK